MVSIWKVNGNKNIESKDKTVRLWRGNWRAWLEVCCNKLRYHPVFQNPQTEVEKQACETCQKYVWSRE